MGSIIAHYRCGGFSLAVSLLFAGCSVDSAFATLATSGVYDENTVQNNVVDVQATTGGGTTVSLGNFTNRMTVAHAVHRGGVIDFDSGTLTDPDTIDATYGKNGKRILTVTNPTIRGMEIVTANAIPEAISGDKGLKKISGSSSFGANDFVFEFDPDDQVVAVGATILWQLGFPTGIGNVTGVARYSDSTSSPFVSRNIPGPFGDNDTFWGFEAPAGASILKLELLVQGDTFPVLDDLAFILAHETADFNTDGVVDGLDFLVWQEGYLTGTSHAQGDANGDNVVSQKDLEIWRSQYGIGGATTAVINAVPEPGTLASALMAIILPLIRIRLT